MAVNTSVELPVLVIVPPLINPARRYQAPIAGDSASVVPALFSVPIRFTVPLVGAVLGRAAAGVNEPPRLTVAPLAAVIVPGLDQLLLIVSVWPLGTVILPWLTNESALEILPTIPLPLWTVMPLSIVSVAPAKFASFASSALLVEPPKTTFPVPESAWLPRKYNCPDTLPLAAPRFAVPLSVSPPVTYA